MANVFRAIVQLFVPVRHLTSYPATPPQTSQNAAVVLTGLHPSPTGHAVVALRFQRRLTRGPAVRATDRRHSLRLEMLAMTRSAYAQAKVRCRRAVERAPSMVRPIDPTREHQT
jgi:hypothetical protein